MRKKENTKLLNWVHIESHYTLSETTNYTEHRQKKKRRRRKSNQTKATEIMIRYRFHYCLWASIKHTSEISLKFFFLFLVSVAVHCFYFDTFWICIYVFHLFLYDLVFFCVKFQFNFNSISVVAFVSSLFVYVRL